MKFVAFAAPVLALLLTGASAAQDQGPAPTFSAEAFRSHVAFLADDALEGREAGTRGYEIAARYVATQFEGLGLRPGANGGWFQPIHFIRYAPEHTRDYGQLRYFGEVKRLFGVLDGRLAGRDYICGDYSIADIGAYGWAGGMGSMWTNDPSAELIGVMLTTDAFAGPFPPPAVIQDFWTGAYTALDS